MKIQVKGLMFVGAAAAIMLSAGTTSAFATDENVVTSKAYTEATYQHLLPYGDGHTGKVIVAGSQKNQVTEKTIDTTVTADSENLVTSGAVAAAISAEGVSGKQTASTANFQIGGREGSWKELVPGTNVALVVDDIDNTKVNLTVAQTDSLANAGTGGGDVGKLITAGAVKSALGDKQDKNLGTGNAGKILVVGNDGVITTSTATGANTYQAKSTTAHQISDGAGSWEDIDTAMVDGTYVTATAGTDTNLHKVVLDIDSNKVNNSGTPLATATNANNSLVTDYTLTTGLNAKQDADVAVKVGTAGTAVGSASKTVYVDNTGTVQEGTTLGTAASATVSTGAPASDNGNLVTGAQVYNYVTSTLGNMPIPATVPDGCKVANAHCALVTSYDTTTSKLSTAWTVMAGAEGGNN